MAARPLRRSRRGGRSARVRSEHRPRRTHDRASLRRADAGRDAWRPRPRRGDRAAAGGRACSRAGLERLPGGDALPPLLRRLAFARRQMPEAPLRRSDGGRRSRGARARRLRGPRQRRASSDDPARARAGGAAAATRSRRCDAAAPERITLGSGRSVPVHYDAGDAAVDRITPAGLLRHARRARASAPARVPLTRPPAGAERARRAGDARSRKLLDAALPAAAPRARAAATRSTPGPRTAQPPSHRHLSRRATKTISAARPILTARRCCRSRCRSCPDRPAHEARRAQLAARLGNRPALIAAGVPRPRNYAANLYPYRASSHFLYLFGLPLRGAVAIYDGAAFTLYLPDAAPDQALWEGRAAGPDEISEATGCPVRPLARLPASVRGRAVATLPAPDVETCLEQSRLLGPRHPPRRHRRARCAARRRDHRAAPSPRRRRARRAAPGCRGHRGGARRRHARDAPGLSAAQVRAAMEAALMARGMACAYPSIVTPHGEILHSERYDLQLADGDLLLADVGAETAGRLGRRRHAHLARVRHVTRPRSARSTRSCWRRRSRRSPR